MESNNQKLFEKSLSSLNKELHLYCYKMLGSFHEAEDALQDVHLSAWKNINTLKDSRAMRSWLYRIATNTCINLCKKRKRDRALPYTEFDRTEEIYELPNPILDPIWIEPYPSQSDPSIDFERREKLKMAYIVAYQNLTPGQRSVLILRDVLSFSAKETGDILDLSTKAVNSLLIRAREKLGIVMENYSQDDIDILNLDNQVKSLADKFLGFWEESDVEGLISMMRDDVRLAMPPLSIWFQGHSHVSDFFRRFVFSKKTKLRAVYINNQIGFAGYRRDENRFIPHTLLLLSIDNRLGEYKINNVISFMGHSMFKAFGLAEEIK